MLFNNRLAMHHLTYQKRFKGKWDVFINLSADSWPVYTPKALSELLGGPLNGINFVTSNKCFTGLVPTSHDLIPRGHPKIGTHPPTYPPITYSEYDKSGKHTGVETIHFHPNSSKVHFGSQWVTLTPSFVEYIAFSMTKRDSLPYLFKKVLQKNGIWMTDETFLPTMLALHPKFKTTLPKVSEKGNLVSNENFFAIRQVHRLKFFHYLFNCCS